MMHARVSYTDGGAMIKGSSDTDWSYATLNTLVFQGDTLWLDTEGALEVEFSGGSFARVADGSKVEVTSLPPSGGLKTWFGSLYVQRTSRSQGDFFVETPACTANIPEDTQARFDVTADGATTISVRWGLARVFTAQGGSVVVGEGQRVFVDPGLLPSTPIGFDRTVEDPFDGWNRERATLLATGGEIPYVTPATTQPLGVTDLGRYGEWVYVDNTSYWRPTVIVDYTPYRYGHWSYAPTYGYVWVGDYPFCYVTSHYGRWTHHDRYGWMWSYSDTWSPAWVASVRYGPNFVWAPLDRYDQPVIIDAYFSAGGIRFSYSTSTWCTADSLLYYGYTNVYPATPTIISPIYADNVYIWNIYVDSDDDDRRDRHHAGPSYDRTLEERDYMPRRVIRGPDTIDPHRPQAAARVQTLEASSGRTSFETARVREVRQTEADSPDRRASVRSVRVSEQAVSETRQELSGVTRPERAGGADATRSVRSDSRADVAPRGIEPSERAERVTRAPSARSESVEQPTTRTAPQERATTDRTERVVTGTSESPGQTRVRTYSPDTARTRIAPESSARVRTHAEQTPSVPNVVGRGRDTNSGGASSSATQAPSQTRSAPERTQVRTNRDVSSRAQVVTPQTTPSAPTPRVRQRTESSSLSTRSERTVPNAAQSPRVSPLPDLPNPITQPARPMQPEGPVIPERVAPAQPQIVPRAPMPEAPTQRMSSPGTEESGRSRVVSQPENITTRRGTVSPGNGPSGRAARSGRN
jgi:hypothetical protein